MTKPLRYLVAALLVLAASPIGAGAQNPAPPAAGQQPGKHARISIHATPNPSMRNMKRRAAMSFRALTRLYCRAFG